MKRRRSGKRIFRTNILYISLFVVLTGLLLYQIHLSQEKLQEERFRNESLQAEREELRLQQEMQEDRLKQSQSPEYIEKLAREKLKMVKPDEILYYIDKGAP